MIKESEGKKFLSSEAAEEIACLELGESFGEFTLVELSETGDDHGFHRFLTFTVGDKKDEGFYFSVFVNGEWGIDIDSDVELTRVEPRIVTITKWVVALNHDFCVSNHSTMIGLNHVQGN